MSRVNRRIVIIIGRLIRGIINLGKGLQCRRMRRRMHFILIILMKSSYKMSFYYIVRFPETILVKKNQEDFKNFHDD